MKKKNIMGRIERHCQSSPSTITNSMLSASSHTSAPSSTPINNNYYYNLSLGTDINNRIGKAASTLEQSHDSTLGCGKPELSVKTAMVGSCLPYMDDGYIQKHNRVRRRGAAIPVDLRQCTYATPVIKNVTLALVSSAKATLHQPRKQLETLG